MRILIAAFVAMCFTGTATAQTEYAGNRAKAASGESELQRMERMLAEAKKARFGRQRSDSHSVAVQLTNAMDAVLDELRLRGEVAWNTERAFWNTALTVVLGDETNEAVIAKRDALLSGMKPRAHPMHLREWNVMAAKSECLFAATQGFEELTELIEGGKGTVDLQMASIASCSEAAVALSEYLMSNIPCDNEELWAELLLELKLKYAKATYAAHLVAWAWTHELKEGGAGTSFEEASARVSLYRSLAELELLRLQRENRGKND